ncbi:MAG: ABC transporter substrate-binding protein [Treponema sp.]|nr:ABC transporter substrate-binding protein [Treponema sp.]
MITLKRYAMLVMLMIMMIALSGKIFALPLRLAILPDADSLPFMLARDEGFFNAEGVDVELVTFYNPQERDAAIQAGKVDGAVSDLLAAALFSAGGFDTKITSLTDGRYGIVASPSFKNKSLESLRGKKIGLSLHTIIQYSVDYLLKNSGIDVTEYEAVSIPRMPIRMEMVLTGQIDAAALPEPLLTAAIQRGAVLLASTDTVNIDAGVLIFSEKILNERLNDVRSFYRAYEKAAEKINSHPDNYRQYLVDKASFPNEVKDAYRFISYRKPMLPATDQIENALSWLYARNLLSKYINPKELIDDRAISQW